MQTQFGTTLKHWRGMRRMSQLDLGLAANVSARHISFLETGRADPSRPMVLQLAETLAVPRAARNGLLTSAGFARVYQDRSLDSADLAQVREAIDWTIARHDPYPAVVLDRLWCLVSANKSGTMMLGAFGVNIGDSMLTAMTESGWQYLENWPEVAHHMIQRLRTESSHFGGVPELDHVANTLAADKEVREFEISGPLPAIIPARYRVGDTVMSLFSTIAQFGAAEDITLADLRIEMMFPADAATKKMFMSAAN